MISKKSRKVVAALLIGATVCASGTFAYFNSTVDMSKIGKNGNAIQSLNITNGHIYVSAAFKGQESATLKDWTYDVARLSTVNALKTVEDGGIAVGAAKSQLQATFDNANYIKMNQSPDITGFGVETSAEGNITNDSKNTDYNGIKRMDIGAPLTGTITKARPGDAIVLGDASTIESKGDYSGTKTGITITNDSNITCKARIVFSNPTDGSADVAKELAGLKEAGWVMYVNGTEIDFSDISANDKGVDQINDILADQATKLAAGTAQTINIRFELPLLTDNAYQNKTNTNAATGQVFDLSKILQITVTQENNPGWNNDGTSTNPATSTPNNGTDSTGTVHNN